MYASVTSSNDLSEVARFHSEKRLVLRDKMISVSCFGSYGMFLFVISEDLKRCIR